MGEEDKGPFLVELSSNNIASFRGKSTFCIGRNPRSDLDLPTRFTSRNQCKFEKVDGISWVLYDESRYQTTEVNKENIAQRGAYTLSDGDIISFTFGGPSYRFCLSLPDEPSCKRRRIDENISLNLDRNESSRNSCINLATQRSPSILSQESQEVERLRTKLREVTEEIQAIKESADGNVLTISSLEVENKTLQELVKQLQQRNENLEARLSKLCTDQLASTSTAANAVATTSSAHSQLDTEHLPCQNIIFEEELASTSAGDISVTPQFRGRNVSSESAPSTEYQLLKEELEDAIEELERLRSERCCQIFKFNEIPGQDTSKIDAIRQSYSEETGAGTIPSQSVPQTENLIDLREEIEDALVEIEKLRGERCCQLYKSAPLSKEPKPNTKIEPTEDIIEVIDDDSPPEMITFINTTANKPEDKEVSASPGWKDMEMLVLTAELKDLRERFEQTNQLLTLSCEDKEAFKNSIVNVLESELYCSICSDLIYEATTLNCKHTFCLACINEWKKKKKECPVCRTKLKVEVQCLLVDALTDKAVNLLGGEVKQRREQLKMEREERRRTEFHGRRGAGGRGGNRRRSRSLVTPAAEQPQLQFLQDLMNLHVYDGIDIRQGDYIIDLTVSPRRNNQFQRGGRRRNV